MMKTLLVIPVPVALEFQHISLCDHTLIFCCREEQGGQADFSE